MRSAVLRTAAPSITRIRIQNSQPGQPYRSVRFQLCSAASREAPVATVNHPPALLMKLVNCLIERPCDEQPGAEEASPGDHLIHGG
jgi:hypothetical protein